MTRDDSRILKPDGSGPHSEPLESPAALLSIAAVERDTGLPKDTLRVWERRYGFPSPGRDANGERVYRAAEVEKLRMVRRLVDAGYRPGKIIGHDLAQLRELAERAPDAVAVKPVDQTLLANLENLLALLREHRVDDLRQALAQAVLRQGLERFVLAVCEPLTRMVGETWARGELQIFEEHLYTESMQAVLRNAITSIPVQAKRPKVLLTTVPTEQHGLGLLMAEAVMALEGCTCISLGTQTPVAEIARAASAQRADVVALSFSTIQNPRAVRDSLTELRAAIPAQAEIWAGGASAALKRRPPPGVVAICELAQIRAAVESWLERNRLA